MNPNSTPTSSIHPAARIGHVHLRVADLDRAVGFYRDALGLTVTADARHLGVPMVLLAAGDYHHHIGLNTFQSADGSPPPTGHTGLYHVGFLYPGRRELAGAVQRLLEHGVAVDHGSDHGATVSVYLADPDGNGIELYYDRPRPEWHDADGRPVLRDDRFDPRGLVSRAPANVGDRLGSTPDPRRRAECTLERASQRPPRSAPERSAMYADAELTQSPPRAGAIPFPDDPNAPGGPSRCDYLRRAYTKLAYTRDLTRFTLAPPTRTTHWGSRRAGANAPGSRAKAPEARNGAKARNRSAATPDSARTV